MTTLTALICFALIVLSCDWIHTQSSNVNNEFEVCPQGENKLCRGTVTSPKITKLSIIEEVRRNRDTELESAYDYMMGNENDRYGEVLIRGQNMSLNENQIQAVFMYSMDRLNKEFNHKLSQGLDPYPVFHYWLLTALDILPRSKSYLYRGERKFVNVTLETKLVMSGFTSTSPENQTVHGFSMRGCTIFEFTSSRHGASIEDLSLYPKEKEVLIPPSEIFEILSSERDGGYHYVKLRPASDFPSEVYRLCQDDDTAANSASEQAPDVILSFSFVMAYISLK